MRFKEDIILQGGNITSLSNGDINIIPNGTGNIILGTIEIDADQVLGAGTDNYVLTYDNASGTVSFEPGSAASFSTIDADYGIELVTSKWTMTDLVIKSDADFRINTDIDDTADGGFVVTLGSLENPIFEIDNDGNAIFAGEAFFGSTTSTPFLGFKDNGGAVNNIYIANAITGEGPNIASVGADADIDLKITTKGDGHVILVNKYISDPTKNSNLSLTSSVSALYSGKNYIEIDSSGDNIVLAINTGNLYFIQGGGLGGGSFFHSNLENFYFNDTNENFHIGYPNTGGYIKNTDSAGTLAMGFPIGNAEEFKIDNANGVITLTTGSSASYISTIELNGTSKVGSYWNEAIRLQLGDVSGITGNRLISIQPNDGIVNFDNFNDIFINDKADLTLDSGSVFIGGGLYINGSRISQFSTKSITIESPTSSEDITWWFTNEPITISELRAVNVGGSSPSVTYTVRHSTDRSATGNQVVTGGTVVTSTTSGSSVTGGFADATIPGNSWIWIETTAMSGSPSSLNITMIYDYD